MPSTIWTGSRQRRVVLVNLAVLFEGDVLHIAHVAPPGVPRSFTALGRRAVAHCTSLGKALLAALPNEEVHAIIERYGWRPYTERSIRDFVHLDTELEGWQADRRIRARSWRAPTRGGLCRCDHPRLRRAGCRGCQREHRGQPL